MIAVYQPGKSERLMQNALTLHLQIVGVLVCMYKFPFPLKKMYTFLDIFIYSRFQYEVHVSVFSQPRAWCQNTGVFM